MVVFITIGYVAMYENDSERLAVIHFKLEKLHRDIITANQWMACIAGTVIAIYIDDSKWLNENHWISWILYPTVIFGYPIFKAIKSLKNDEEV